jgi:hypothetical protein
LGIDLALDEVGLSERGVPDDLLHVIEVHGRAQRHHTQSEQGEGEDLP